MSFFVYTHQYEADKTLKMANIVYRHGARSPIAFYPNDPYQEKFWPDGSGRLTQYGMRLEYDLGKFFKERYMTNTSFISQQYVHKEVYIQSSDVDRCIESAETQLAAIYPPKGYQIWNTEIPWQPIPIHSIPMYEDVMLNPQKVYCPRLQQLLKDKQSSPEFKRKVLENKELLNKLSNHSGMAVNLQNIYYISDPVKCEKAEGLKIPKWIDELWEQVLALSDWCLVYKFSGGDEIGRLLGGSLLGKINENMKKLSEEKDVENLFKLNMWSGHDTSLLSLCSALDIKLHVPNYAASLMIELYHSTTKGYFVQILYRKDFKNTVKQLKLKECDVSCPLDQFLKLTKVRTTMDRRKICGGGNFEESTLKTKTIVVLFLGCTLLSIVIMITLCLTKRSSLFIQFGYKPGYNSYFTGEEDILVKSMEEKQDAR